MARESCNLDKEEAELMKPTPSSSSPPPASPPSSSPTSLKPSHQFPDQRPERPEIPVIDEDFSASFTPKARKESRLPIGFSSRCSCCRKRVGLTGFRCRCGDLFCARHRYSETHDCSFDYKAAGKEEISRANPLIRAAKIIKI